MKKIPIVGPLLGALVASLCCIGPALLVALGAGSFGAAKFFAKFHLYFYVAGFLIMGVALYFSMRKKDPACDCETGPARATKLFPTGLKFLAFLAIFFAASYGLIYWIAPSIYQLRSYTPVAVSAQASPVKTVVARFSVHGMDCALCTVGIEAQLRRLPGVYASRVSFSNKTGMVCYDPQKTSPKEIQAAIHQVGYTATLLKQKSCPKPGSLSVL